MCLYISLQYRVLFKQISVDGQRKMQLLGMLMELDSDTDMPKHGTSIDYYVHFCLIFDHSSFVSAFC